MTDNQSFCYDEQNRLTWASSYSGTGPCGIVNNGGSLTSQGAKYTATYSYDSLDRLTSGPANGGSSYSYGDSAHLHAATATSGGYSATYDASGNMTCRAPTSSATCTGSSPTGAGLSYDNEGQLVGWTSALNGNPTPATAAYAYDGEGARVALKTTTGTGIVTTTDYLLGGLEEQQTVGGSVRPSSTLTEYYPLPGIGTAVRVNTSSGSSTLSYLASDQLGSVSVALSTSGTVTAQALYSPYGTVRYSSGSMPTAHGYTGQLADAMTGLDYYGARYYDPSLGEFTSADTEIDGGLDRYAYVGDSPCTYNDPSGHCAKPRDRMPWSERLKRFFIGLLIAVPGLIPGHNNLGAPQTPAGSNRPGTGVVEQKLEDSNPQSSIAGGSAGGCGDDGPKKGGTTTIYVGGVDTVPESDQGTVGTSGTEESFGSQRGSNSDDAGGQGSGQEQGSDHGQGHGSPSSASIVPGRGWARWMSYEGQQDRQAQLAQMQDARTAHLIGTNYAPTPANVTYLPGGYEQMTTGCEAMYQCRLYFSEHNAQFQPFPAVPKGAPEWLQVATEVGEATGEVLGKVA